MAIGEGAHGGVEDVTYTKESTLKESLYTSTALIGAPWSVSLSPLDSFLFLFAGI